MTAYFHNLPNSLSIHFLSADALSFVQNEKSFEIKKGDTKQLQVVRFMLCFFTTHCSRRLIVRSELGASTRVTTREHPTAEGGTVGEKCPGILPKC